MARKLKVAVGQCSDKGRKEVNQDFYGIYIPKEPQLGSKGVALALADGISSSPVSQVASEAAVRSFLEDYYCTSEAWSVKKSAQSVLNAINSWLYAQTRKSDYRYDRDKGYVCTLSAMIIKSTTAYLFHVGDSRIYRLCDNTLEQLTEDHRVFISQEQSYLGRALGINQHLDIDYRELQVEKGDIFILATDGVYEYVDPQSIGSTINAHKNDLDQAASRLVADAYQRGSTDNLTVQILLIEELAEQAAGEVQQQLAELPLPPLLQARMIFDGYRIIRDLHSNHRSHIYLAEELDSGEQVVIKIPSMDMRNDPAYLERFMLEEWVARRINSAHVLKPCATNRKRNYLYVVTEFVEGRTLAQWMIDNPQPAIETVRGIVEQIAKGLQAFHRLEMLHQDLRPNNIMIDDKGTIKIIDFGSVSVAGLLESAATDEPEPILGTVQYTAPEYFLGERGTAHSDLFSLGVITYQMLSGRLPYGADVAKSRTRSAQMKLKYRSVLDDDREIPAWVDYVLKKAVHPNPYRRYDLLSEYVYELRYPSQDFLRQARPPLLERNPVAFWQGVSFILAVIIAVLLVGRTGGVG